jgi:hypothetical protein
MANQTATTEELKQKFPRTIAEELHNAWAALRRKRDPETIAEALKVSRPIIDKALIYGHVTMTGLTDKITKFFEDRLIKERKDADKLLTMQRENAARLTSLSGKE